MNSASQLMVQEKTTIIDSLARERNIIKSLFHFKKPISFLVVSLAIQKLRNISYKDNIIVVSKNEIKYLAQGNDLKIGVNKLITEIKKDILKHNYFHKYIPNSGLKKTETTLLDEISITDDLFEDLYLIFKKSLFKTFKTENNYTIQSLKQIRACEENQKMILYTIIQPYAKSQALQQYTITKLKQHLRIDPKKYQQISQLTRHLKRMCEFISENTDIDLSFNTIKSGNKTVGYNFYSKYKKPQKSINALPMKKPTQTNMNITTTLKKWGVGEDQIQAWIQNIPHNEIIDAIQKTSSKKSIENRGGYLYKILGDGNKSQNKSKQFTNTDIEKLTKFGFTQAEIKHYQSRWKNILTSIVTKTINKLSTDKDSDAKDIFIEIEQECWNDLKKGKIIQ